MGGRRLGGVDDDARARGRRSWMHRVLGGIASVSWDRKSALRMALRGRRTCKRDRP